MSYDTPRKRVSTKIGMLRSRNNFPQPVKYKGVEIVMSPRGSTMKDIDFNLLDEALPAGIVFIQN
jgi:hypothetical protein